MDWGSLPPEVWKGCLAATCHTSLLRARLACRKLAAVGLQPEPWAAQFGRAIGCPARAVGPLHSTGDSLMLAFGRALRLLRLRRRGNRELDRCWSPGTPEAGRGSDARKAVQTLQGSIPRLALMGVEPLEQYLHAAFERRPFARIAIRNLLRRCAHPAVYQRAAAELVLMMGLPCAGKSRYVAQHLPGHRVVFDLAGLKAAIAEDSGQSIVVDARNSNSQRHRAPIILVAEAIGRPVRIVHVATPFSECKQRNRLRPEEERASSFAFTGFQQYFEPPSELEGAREVLVVSSGLST